MAGSCTSKNRLARVAQGIEHRFPKAGVGGSNPPVGALLTAAKKWQIYKSKLPSDQ